MVAAGKNLVKINGQLVDINTDEGQNFLLVAKQLNLDVYGTQDEKDFAAMMMDTAQITRQKVESRNSANDKFKTMAIDGSLFVKADEENEINEDDKNDLKNSLMPENTKQWYDDEFGDEENVNRDYVPYEHEKEETSEIDKTVEIAQDKIDILKENIESIDDVLSELDEQVDELENAEIEENLEMTEDFGNQESSELPESESENKEEKIEAKKKVNAEENKHSKNDLIHSYLEKMANKPVVYFHDEANGYAFKTIDGEWHKIDYDVVNDAISGMTGKEKLGDYKQIKTEAVKVEEINSNKTEASKVNAISIDFNSIEKFMRNAKDQPNDFEYFSDYLDYVESNFWDEYFDDYKEEGKRERDFYSDIKSVVEKYYDNSVNKIKSSKVTARYSVRKQGDKWIVWNKDTDKSEGESETKEKAMAHMRALYAHMPEKEKKVKAENAINYKIGDKFKDSENNEFVIDEIINRPSGIAIGLKGNGGEKEISSQDLKFFKKVEDNNKTTARKKVIANEGFNSDQQMQIFIAKPDNPSDGKWVNIPTNPENIQKAMAEIGEEVIISDYNTPFSVSEYDNPLEINEIAKQVSEFDAFQKAAISAYTNIGYTTKEAVDKILEGDYDFIEADSDQELGYNVWSEGMWTMPEGMEENYLDFDKIGEEFEMNNSGAYVEVEGKKYFVLR